MPNITIKEKQLVIGKEKVDLLSGEVHYWRLNPDFWEDVVDTVRECGLNVIASYVPWQFHRTEDGKLDFTGETSPFRDLVRFIKLLKKKKMWLIIRPGPYLYTEWVNKGVPDEMVQYHRNHPEFKKRSEVYIKEVCRIISPFLASKGGNIIMVQADNEIDMWAHLYEKDLGFLDEPGMFQDFIKKKYKNITVLNKEWGTSLKDLSDAKPIAYDIIKDKYFKKRYRDFSEFKHFYASEFARWVVGKYKEEGIDVPIYLNTYPWFESHDWREFQRIADVVGTDFYPVNEFGGSNNKHRIFMDYIRYIRTFSRLPYIAEFECGIWHGHHYALKILNPNHYSLISYSALLAGIVGWNWYMLVNRDNWYMSPINEYGRKRGDLFGVFKEIVAIYKTLEPAKCRKITDTGVTFDMEQMQTGTFMNDHPVLNSLYNGDIDYDFFDVETASLKKKILFYANKQYLAEKKQKILLEYVMAGGILVVFQDHPRQNERYEPMNLLGIPQPDKILPEHYLDIDIGNSSASILSSIFVYNKVDGMAIRAKVRKPEDSYFQEDRIFDSLNTDVTYAVGCIQKRGKGKLVTLGVKPDTELLILLHRYFNINIPCRSTLPGITTALFKKKDEYYLIAVNNAEESKYSMIELDKKLFPAGKPERKLKGINLLNNEKCEMNASGEIPVYVPRKSGTIVRIRQARS